MLLESLATQHRTAGQLANKKSETTWKWLWANGGSILPFAFNIWKQPSRNSVKNTISQPRFQLATSYKSQSTY